MAREFWSSGSLQSVATVCQVDLDALGNRHHQGVREVAPREVAPDARGCLVPELVLDKVDIRLREGKFSAR